MKNIPARQQTKLDLHLQQALIFQKKQQYDHAEMNYQAALAINNRHYKTLFNYSLMNFEIKKIDDAISFLTQAIEINPNAAPAFYNRALMLHIKGASDKAFTDVSASLEIQPEYIKALELQAILYKKQKQYKESLLTYSKLIKLNPDNILYHHESGVIFQDLRLYKEAVEAYEIVLNKNPDNALVLANISLMLFDLKQYKSALIAVNRALAINPKEIHSYQVRGMIAGRMGRPDLAKHDYDFAISHGHKDPETVFGSGIIDLTLGEYESGWKKYEARWENTGIRQVVKTGDFTDKQWRGETSLRGKTLYVYWEQGLGDTLQFCRYIPLLAEDGINILFEVQKPFKDLMELQFGHIATILTEEPEDGFDYVCPLLSLPLAFRTTLETIPAPTRYLAAQEAKVAQWRAHLPAKRKPRIGLVWSGSLTHGNDILRSIPAELLATLFSDDYEFICLQKEIRPQDKLWLEKNPCISEYSADLQDFADTAALCELMDIVISVDTSVAHLAGALGKPLWLLLSFTSEWRWMHQRTDNLWYPSARLYRQPRQNEWQEILHQVRADLDAYFQQPLIALS